MKNSDKLHQFVAKLKEALSGGVEKVELQRDRARKKLSSSRLANASDLAWVYLLYNIGLEAKNYSKYENYESDLVIRLLPILIFAAYLPFKHFLRKQKNKAEKK